MILILALCILTGSFALSAILTALVRRHSLKRDFVARPAADRFHQSVIPLGGGIAITWTIVISLLAAAATVKFILEPGYLTFIERCPRALLGDGPHRVFPMVDLDRTAAGYQGTVRAVERRSARLLPTEYGFVAVSEVVAGRLRQGKPISGQIYRRFNEKRPR